MNIFRGYTDGLTASYQVATYQSGSFRPSAKKAAAPRSAVRRQVRASLAAALTAVGSLAQKIFKRRGGTPAPSSLSVPFNRVPVHAS